MHEGDIILPGLRCFPRRDADYPQRRMLGRIRHLPLQRLEPAPHDVGFREAKLAGQLVQPPALFPIEINLNRLAYTVSFVIMRSCHEIMIIIS